MRLHPWRMCLEVGTIPDLLFGFKLQLANDCIAQPYLELSYATSLLPDASQLRWMRTFQIQRCLQLLCSEVGTSFPLLSGFSLLIDVSSQLFRKPLFVAVTNLEPWRIVKSESTELQDGPLCRDVLKRRDRRVSLPLYLRNNSIEETENILSSEGHVEWLLQSVLPKRVELLSPHLCDCNRCRASATKLQQLVCSFWRCTVLLSVVNSGLDAFWPAFVWWLKLELQTEEGTLVGLLRWSILHPKRKLRLYLHERDQISKCFGMQHK